MPTGPRPAPPTDTVRVILSGTNLGHRWVAIWWLQITQTSRAAADLQYVLDQISALWNTNIVPIVTNNTILSQIEGIWITPGPGEIIATNGTVRTGTLSETIVLDAAASYVTSWHISAYYRGGHPRTYLPGVTTARINSGSDITGAAQSALQSAMLAVLNGINALTHGGITGVTMGTVSFQTAHAWRTPPIFRPYIGVGVSGKLGTQRRRIHS